MAWIGPAIAIVLITILAVLRVPWWALAILGGCMLVSLLATVPALTP